MHGAYVSETEIKRAVDHLKAQGKPVYDETILKPREEDLDDGGAEDELSDELYDQALATVSEMRQVTISMLQRKMRIGYNRAARMIERMERDGVVGPADGAKPREVLLRAAGRDARRRRGLTPSFAKLLLRRSRRTRSTLHSTLRH